MSTTHWPPDAKRSSPQPAPEFSADSLSDATVDYYAASLPGPKRETEAERAVRVAAHREKILSYGPRNSIEAILATHCILMGMIASAARPPCSPSRVNQLLRVSKQLFDQLNEMKRLAAQRPPPPSCHDIIQEMLAARGLGEPPAPATIDDPQVDGAVSAVIIPLHPAPTMLQ